MQDALLAHLIRQRLEFLPAYTVFDWLEFRVEGTTVILSGMAASPELPARAMRVISALPVIEKTVSLVERLPDSLQDDVIRAEAYSRIYKDPILANHRSLFGRLAPHEEESGLPSGPHAIRILVRDGFLTLRGEVSSAFELERARQLAREIHGVVGFECRLRVASNRN
jgi:osmotically-inducible protein OsmY